MNPTLPVTHLLLSVATEAAEARSRLVRGGDKRALRGQSLRALATSLLRRHPGVVPFGTLAGDHRPLTRDCLAPLFADGAVVDDLQALGAGVALMPSDFSAERAVVVRTLNEAGVPVVAVPLVPAEDGYYFTADDPTRAAARYDE